MPYALHIPIVAAFKDPHMCASHFTPCKAARPTSSSTHASYIFPYIVVLFPTPSAFSHTQNRQQQHLDVVKWLHENRTEGCTTGAMRFAAMRGHFEVLLFLHANRSEGFLRGAVYSGVEYLNHLEILQWVLANYPDSVNMNSLRGHGGYMAHVLEHVLS